MTEKSNSHRGARLLVIGAALVIIIEGINQAEPVLASFLVAVFLSVIGTPSTSHEFHFKHIAGRELSTKDIPPASKKHKLSGNRND
jgi:hypothetical protein